MNSCGICNSPQLEEIEQLGQEALSGDRSWRSVQMAVGWYHHTPIKNHMEKHWVAPASPQEQALSEWETLVADTIVELAEQLRFAPTEVKPFYLVAIQNLKSLDLTKPSQNNLITALKAIHEVTGMKMEQQMMLGFARAMFGTPAIDTVEVEVIRELESV